MTKLIAPLMLAILCSSTTAVHAGDAALEAPIRAMEAAFNKGDAAAAKATHVAAPTIVDELGAPYVWSGATAFDDWLKSLSDEEAAAGKSGGVVKLGAPIRESVEGTHGYVITPSTYTFQQKGKIMRETGTMTFALVETEAGWKIAAWTWTSLEAVPVG